MTTLVWLALAVLPAANDTHVQHGLRLPTGFEVAEFADSKLAHDIYCMTVDPRGRIVVAGRGYIRILVDDDADGRADRAITFADGPKDGAMGLLWEGNTLFVMGDGGLRRYRDENGDDQADGPSELIRAMKTGGEHHAHAIRRGPDGWLYVLCGDGAGVDKSYATLPTSPIKDPIGGCVVRFTPDLKNSEIVAHGFRNAYDMDFNPDSELFTYDSDNERCVSLPWYEGTRFYHVIPGGHHGWLAPQRASFWRYPPYFPDVVAPVTTLGRGSPTGCVCYRHAQFPPKYRGGFFLLDWTFGRVYFVPLERSGSRYMSKPEVFIQSVGDNGFAPTSAVVHPKNGDLYVAIGGRGTRGAVYRIRHPRGLETLTPLNVARVQMRERRLDWRPGDKAELLQQATSTNARARLQALVSIQRHAEHYTSAEIREALEPALDDYHLQQHFWAARLAACLEPAERSRLFEPVGVPKRKATNYLAAGHGDFPGQLETSLALLTNKRLEPGARLLGVRLLQLAIGDQPPSVAKGTVWEGYSVARRKELAAPTLRDAARQCLATPVGKESLLTVEIARFLAYVEDPSPEAVTWCLRQLEASASPVQELHYLIVLARLSASRQPQVTARVAEKLLALDRKITELHLNRDRNWPLRVVELHAELAKKDPNLNAALLAHAEFGRPDHVLFTQCPGFARRQAAEIFLNKAEADAEFAWSPQLVTLMGDLPADRALPVARRLWNQLGLQEAILELLCRRPALEDRDKFLSGLSSPQFATVRRCLDALEKMPAVTKDTDLLTCLLALRRLGDSKEELAIRERLASELGRASGQKLAADRQAWTSWFARAHPGLAARLEGPDGVDRAAWQKRLANVGWENGSAERGRKVYERVACASCHSGTQTLGPDLVGATQRFSRDDLFTAILQPSKDVSPRYQTIIVSTDKGQVYQGTVAYEAVDSLILLTGPATNVRLPGDAVVSRRMSPNSLMPAGLLDKLNDGEIADLYAYMRNLSAGAKPR